MAESVLVFRVPYLISKISLSGSSTSRLSGPRPLHLDLCFDSSSCSFCTTLAPKLPRPVMWLKPATGLRHQTSLSPTVASKRHSYLPGEAEGHPVCQVCIQFCFHLILITYKKCLNNGDNFSSFHANLQTYHWAYGRNNF